MAELSTFVATARAISVCLCISTVFDSEVGHFRGVDIRIRPVGLRHLYVVGILGPRRSSVTLWFRPVLDTGLEGLLLDMR
jgi:hypothetical protein